MARLLTQPHGSESRSRHQQPPPALAPPSPGPSAWLLLSWDISKPNWHCTYAPPTFPGSSLLVTQAETLGVILGCPPALATCLTQREIQLALPIHQLPTSLPGGHLPGPGPPPGSLPWSPWSCPSSKLCGGLWCYPVKARPPCRAPTPCLNF